MAGAPAGSAVQAAAHQPPPRIRRAPTRAELTVYALISLAFGVLVVHASIALRLSEEHRAQLPGRRSLVWPGMLEVIDADPDVWYSPDEGARIATLMAKHASSTTCIDKGPWPCQEAGCPSGSVDCTDLANSCDRTFGDIFREPPAGLAGANISRECPRLCGVCAPVQDDEEARQRRIEANRAAAANATCMRGGRVYRGRECAGAGGAGVWGVLWGSKAPVGENLGYERPKEIREYEGVLDGTSYTQARSLARRGALGAKCRRYFHTGDRGDMKRTVSSALKHIRGMCAAPSDSIEGADFVWERPWEMVKLFFRDRLIRPGTIVNSIAGLPQQIGQKTSLARLHVRCVNHAGYSELLPAPPHAKFCRFTLRAFPVQRDGAMLVVAYRRFREYNQWQTHYDMTAGREAEGHRIWILKPQGGFNQVGIHMHSIPRAAYSSDERTLAWLKQRIPDGTWVLQEYMMNPMLYKGHKFDMRIWAVVTSLDPLRVHMLSTGVPKVSQWVYSKAPKDVKEQCIHVLMPGTAECFESKRADVLAVRPYPKRTDVASWYDAITPPGEKHWREKVWPSIEWSVVELLLLAREAVLHIDHELKRKGFQYKRIFFLQPDVVIDRETGRASMVEVNTNGYMVGNLHKVYFELQKEEKALFKLVGADGFPDQIHYHAALRNETASFCDEHQCSDSTEAELWEMVHEDMHTMRAWYRAYPSQSMHARLVQSKHYAKSLTPLDRLAHAFKWRPAHYLDRNGTVHLKVRKAQQRQDRDGDDAVEGADRPDDGSDEESHDHLLQFERWHKAHPKMAKKLLRQAGIKFEKLPLP